MARDMVPIFGERAPEPAARAMSEVFLRPDEFTVGLEDITPDLDPEDLVGFAAVYVEPVGERYIGGNLARAIDPNNRFSLPDAAEAFVYGYHGQLSPLHAMIKFFDIQGAIPKKVFRELSKSLASIVSRGDLQTIGALAVTGTPKQYTAQFVTPRRVGGELGVLMRDRMRSTEGSDLKTALTLLPEGMRGKIMTQDPVIHQIGVLVAAHLMPTANTILD